MNNAYEAINFTIEKGNIDELAFLDVQVLGNKNRFNFCVEKENFYRMLIKFLIKL